MPGLQPVGGGGGPDAQCVGCGAMAVGPCARCHDPLCGDCCVITEGAKQWAVCAACAEGPALSSGWSSVIMWIAAPIVVLLLLLFLLDALTR